MGLTLVATLIIIIVTVITINEDYDMVAQSCPLLRGRGLPPSPSDPLNKRPRAVFSGCVTQPSPSRGSLRQTDAADKPQANVLGEFPIATLGLGLRSGVPVTVD